jgi:branched-chain amino acid transport system permease protein
LGGLGSLAGAIWGAAAIVLVPTWAEDLSKALSLPAKVEANLPLAVYGIVLIVVMLAAPQGIQGAVRRAAALVTGQRVRGRPAEQEEEVVCEVEKGP